MNTKKLIQIRDSVGKAVAELLQAAQLKPGQIVVVGCSTSEIQGKRIGKSSSEEIGEAVFGGIMPLIQKNDLFLAVQGCEHINRALLVEEECAEKYDLEIINVIPQLHAGGGFTVTAYRNFQQPVMVESITAHAGLDIGDTFIGMHLRSVVVPVRSEIKSIGEAHLTMARTRPKLIGGERAKRLNL